MPLTLTYPRLWTLTAGRAMVVTDLHGDGEAYRRYRDRFVALHAAGQADCLIVTGDLIHREGPPETDESLAIVLDVLALRQAYGEAIIYLCGNHELAHIYALSLTKGETDYTPFFEMELNDSGRRAEIIELFMSLPFYLRTPAGVTLTHAGAPSVIANPDDAYKIFTWSHQEMLAWADTALASTDVEELREGYALLNQAPYDYLADYWLDLSDPHDPRYNDLLRAFLLKRRPEFNQILWPALFTRCEVEYGLPRYLTFVEALLREVGRDFAPQKLLVTGHMPIRGGYQLVGERQVRLASATHANPPQAGLYLLFDVAEPVASAVDLLEGLGSVF
jgi:hypothetical protein